MLERRGSPASPVGPPFALSITIFVFNHLREKQGENYSPSPLENGVSRIGSRYALMRGGKFPPERAKGSGLLFPNTQTADQIREHAVCLLMRLSSAAPGR